MISRRCALLAFLGAIMTSPGKADATEMAASQGGAIALTAAPTRIALQPAGNVDLAAAFAAAGHNFILTLQGLATDSPPGTGYLVFLNVPEGVTPAVDDIGYAGAVSFFGVPPSAADTDARAVSFEVSEVVQRLRAAGRLASAMTVTIRPAGKPAAGSHPTIRRIALFEQ
jgi:DNA-binding beta-propeller fold protein YncE